MKFSVGDQIRLVSDPFRGVFTIGTVYEVGGRWANNKNSRYVGILSNDKGCQDQWYSECFEPIGGPW